MTKTPVRIVPVNTVSGLYRDPLPYDEVMSFTTRKTWDRKLSTACCGVIIRVNEWIDNIEAKIRHFAPGTPQHSTLVRKMNEADIKRELLERKYLDALQKRYGPAPKSAL